MTPTRYPTWRSLAYAIVIIEALSLAVMVGRYDIHALLHPSGSPSMLRVSLFSQALTLIGAVTMRWRPGPGFCIFGAGFLIMGAVLLVLLPWERPLLIPVAFLMTLGLVYTGLGVKQLGPLRG